MYSIIPCSFADFSKISLIGLALEPNEFNLMKSVKVEDSKYNPEAVIVPLALISADAVITSSPE